MSDSRYPLSKAEAEQNMHGALRFLIYAVLGFVIAVTAVHAITLVTVWTQQTEATGLIQWIMMTIRIASPVVVELAAIVAGIGFIKASWRGSQKTVATLIELTWLTFAALNMTTVFALEHGDALQNWQSLWVRYGLPLSAVVAGTLVYMLLRQDPAHLRANERALGAEQVTADAFNAAQTVQTSEAMRLILQRREWRNVINRLAAEGYTPDEIAFITQYIPGLSPVAMPPDALPAPEPSPALLDRARAYLRNNTHTTSDTPASVPGQGELPAGVGPVVTSPAPVYSNGQEAGADAPRP